MNKIIKVPFLSRKIKDRSIYYNLGESFIFIDEEIIEEKDDMTFSMLRFRRKNRLFI